MIDEVELLNEISKKVDAINIVKANHYTLISANVALDIYSEVFKIIHSMVAKKEKENEQLDLLEKW